MKFKKLIAVTKQTPADGLKRAKAFRNAFDTFTQKKGVLYQIESVLQSLLHTTQLTRTNTDAKKLCALINKAKSPSLRDPDFQTRRTAINTYLQSVQKILPKLLKGEKILAPVTDFLSKVTRVLNYINSQSNSLKKAKHDTLDSVIDTMNTHLTLNSISVNTSYTEIIAQFPHQFSKGNKKQLQDRFGEQFDTVFTHCQTLLNLKKELHYTVIQGSSPDVFDLPEEQHVLNLMQGLADTRPKGTFTAYIEKNIGSATVLLNAAKQELCPLTPEDTEQKRVSRKDKTEVKVHYTKQSQKQYMSVMKRVLSAVVQNSHSLHLPKDGSRAVFHLYFL